MRGGDGETGTGSKEGKGEREGGERGSEAAARHKLSEAGEGTRRRVVYLGERVEHAAGLTGGAQLHTLQEPRAGTQNRETDHGLAFAVRLRGLREGSFVSPPYCPCTVVCSHTDSGVLSYLGDGLDVGRLGGLGQVGAVGPTALAAVRTRRGRGTVRVCFRKEYQREKRVKSHRLEVRWRGSERLRCRLPCGKQLERPA